jgi:predicted O-methyltransferase YrrM
MLEGFFFEEKCFMSATPTYLNNILYQYILDNTLREPDILRALRLETQKMEGKEMQISPDQGQFMRLLIQLINAKNTIEVGIFTGYSALSVALALPENGKIIACDISEKTTLFAKTYWEKAGVAHKISAHIAPATETLSQLIKEKKTNQFDFAFIDADKEQYELYYELCLELIRPRGLIVIDNTLWDGDVVNTHSTRPTTQALVALNKKLHDDSRIELSLIGIGDGLTLAMKK